MRSQNFLANYEQRFASLFGAIDPDQNWDFSDVELPSAKTRAGDDDEIVPITDMKYAISQDELDSRWTKDWYYVESATLDKVKEYLPEGNNKDNVTRLLNTFVNGKSIGSSFTLEVPDCGFKITPIFQGANDWHPTTYMTVTYEGKSKTYRLWGEGEHIECIRSGTTANNPCYHCGGTGKAADLTSTHVGELVDVYTVKNRDGSYYLNNKGIGSTTTNFAVIKDKSNNLHLYSLAAQAYLVANSTNGDLNTTSNINDASILTYTSGGQLKLDGKFLYIDSKQLKKADSYNNNNKYKWTWTRVQDYIESYWSAPGSVPVSELALIEKILHTGTIDCPTCGGTGKSQWESAGRGRLGTTDDSWVALSNIRGNSLVFKQNDLPVGATIVFKNIVTETFGVNPQGEPDKIEDGKVKLTDNPKTNYFYSTAPKGKVPYILSFDIPRPTNIIATTPVNGVDVPHEVMIIACEGGDNDDMNEVVYIIEGDPYLPKIRETEEWRFLQSKRYMVEDMGYSGNQSQAVSLGYTDIDFNDIVVDFSKEQKYEIKFNGATPTGEVNPTTEYRQRAVIRALGGTWDFILKVAGEPVFQKSKSENTAQTIRLNGQNKTLPPVIFNTNYVMYDGTDSATPLSAKGPLNYGIMYNTSKGGIDNVDGHFEQNLESNQAYICIIESKSGAENAIGSWNPEDNNIEFVIYDSGTSDKYYDSKNEVTNGDKDPQYSDQKNVYNIGFPSVGATPKIVAFPNAINEKGQVTNMQEWKGEKVHVDKNWFPKRSN